MNMPQTYDEKALTAVKRVIAERGLPFNVIKKSDSNLMRFIGFVAKPFNPDFMSKYTTTIPFLGRIYSASGITESSWWRTLAHEGMHLEQARRDGQLKFALKYLFPQCLALFALLAFGAFLWFPMIWCLAFLAFLAPWPAKYRAKYEREAYIVSGAMDAIRGTDVRSVMYTEYMMKHYVGWGYYRPVWLRSSIKTIIRAEMIYAEVIAEMTELAPLSTSYDWTVVREVKAALETK